MEVSLVTCYQFCAVGPSFIPCSVDISGVHTDENEQGIFGIDMGCKSFEFYPKPGTGTPRCNLYGASVAQSLDMIIHQVPNIWYVVGCIVSLS